MTSSFDRSKRLWTYHTSFGEWISLTAVRQGVDGLVLTRQGVFGRIILVLVRGSSSLTAVRQGQERRQQTSLDINTRYLTVNNSSTNPFGVREKKRRR